MAKTLSSCCPDIAARIPSRSSTLFQKHKTEVQKLRTDGYIPNVTEKKEYKFFLIKNGLFFPHWSVVVNHVGSEDRYFCIHLGFMQEGETCYMYPLLGPIDKKHVWKLKEIGTLTKTGRELMDAAWAALEKLGEYDQVYSNCQDFCNLLLAELGLPPQQSSFDNIKDVSNVTSPCCVCTKRNGGRRRDQTGKRDNSSAENDGSFDDIQGNRIV